MTQPEDLIVGKSVEEIEGESGNRVNSPVPGEDHREDVGAVLIPAAGGQMGVGQTAAGTLGVLPGVIGTERRNDDAVAGARATDLQTGQSQTDHDRDSSEE
ncbi:hypothetical protein [Deinococcus sp.]|uniref:hypothetical protein n=1 Tax=Deinococcus sp. TaxID=47478 RepID=UPI003C7CA83E